MNLLEILSFCWVFTSVLSGPLQTSMSDDTALRIPYITLDGRKNCGVEKFLSDIDIDPISCDVVLPIDGNWFSRISPTLCYGIYDTLFELCKYQNISSLEIPKYSVGDFCKKATKAFVNYNFVPHRQPVFVEWSPNLRALLGGPLNCTEVCVHGEYVNPKCSIIVAALERLPIAMAAFNQSKSKEVTPSVDVKGSIPSGVQKQPAWPTKGSKPVLVEAKTPELEPVALNPVSSKTDEVAADKPTFADKTAPQPAAVKSKQVPKFESEPPSEPKLENPELEPAMNPEAIEDEEGPGMEAQQPPPAEPQPDLVPAKDAPNELNKFSDDDSGKQENPMSFPGETPYLSIPKDDSEETNMVTYFVLMTGGALLFYIAFHNKNKLLALALEGRRTGRRGGRHSSALYSKLHSNLEETIASGPTSPSATHVLY